MSIQNSIFEHSFYVQTIGRVESLTKGDPLWQLAGGALMLVSAGRQVWRLGPQRVFRCLVGRQKQVQFDRSGQVISPAYARPLSSCENWLLFPQLIGGLGLLAVGMGRMLMTPALQSKPVCKDKSLNLHQSIFNPKTQCLFNETHVENRGDQGLCSLLDIGLEGSELQQLSFNPETQCLFNETHVENRGDRGLCSLVDIGLAGSESQPISFNPETQYLSIKTDINTDIKTNIENGWNQESGFQVEVSVENQPEWKDSAFKAVKPFSDFKDLVDSENLKTFGPADFPSLISVLKRINIGENHAFSNWTYNHIADMGIATFSCVGGGLLQVRRAWNQFFNPHKVDQRGWLNLASQIALFTGSLLGGMSYFAMPSQGDFSTLARIVALGSTVGAMALWMRQISEVDVKEKFIKQSDVLREKAIKYFGVNKLGEIYREAILEKYANPQTKGFELISIFDFYGKEKSYLKFKEDEGVEGIENTLKSEYKIIPLPKPEKAITVGLENLGNTCWLNTALKFIASTDFYDDMLNSPLPKNAQQGALEVQHALREIILRLRLNQEVKTQHLQRLGKAVPQALSAERAKEFAFDGKQKNAEEFLEALTDILCWKYSGDGKRARHSREEYKEFPVYGEEWNFKKNNKEESLNLTRDPTEPRSKPNIIITCDYSQLNAEELNLQSLFEAPEVLSEVSCNQEGKFAEFEKINRFTYLPKVLMVHVKRGVIDGNSLNNEIQEIEEVTKQVTAPFVVDESGFINLNQYKFNSEEIKKFVYFKEVKYRVDAMMVKSGGGNSGHWECYVRDPKKEKKLVCHSDKKVKAVENIKINGVYLRLTRVD